MPIATGMAIYFIFWWLTLFTVLPFGLRTQADEDDVTLGTTASAPHKHRMGRVFQPWFLSCSTSSTRSLVSASKAFRFSSRNCIRTAV